MNDRRSALSARRPRQWQDWISLVLGVWVFVSPWLLYAAQVPGTASWNSWVVGAAIAAIALSAILSFREWEEWISGALGLWLVISPWVLGFAGLTAATWNAVICGVLVMALAIEELWEIRHARPTQA